MERRLAAIPAADVVGYSCLMERDEAGTLDALKIRCRDILRKHPAKTAFDRPSRRDRKIEGRNALRSKI
jgi:hypothetical protein